jgi:hypothetical protein
VGIFPAEYSRSLLTCFLAWNLRDTGTMTTTFYDKAGREMLVEQIS